MFEVTAGMHRGQQCQMLPTDQEDTWWPGCLSQMPEDVAVTFDSCCV